jgi:hypothetical protein
MLFCYILSVSLCDRTGSAALCSASSDSGVVKLPTASQPPTRANMLETRSKVLLMLVVSTIFGAHHQSGCLDEGGGMFDFFLFDRSTQLPLLPSLHTKNFRTTKSFVG